MDLLPFALKVFTKKTDEDETSFEIPVSEICGIPIGMWVRKDNKCRNKPYRIRITNDTDRIDRIDENGDYDNELFNRWYDSLKDALQVVDTILQKPIWDGLNSQFRLEEQPKEQESCMKAFYEKYKSQENVKLSYGDCCVCAELTSAITGCNHRICLRCHTGIVKEARKKNDGARDYETLPCPMCRQDYYLKT